MGFLARFRKKQAAGPPASAPASGWLPTFPEAAVARASLILTGRPDDERVRRVYAATVAPLERAYGDQLPFGWSEFPEGPLAHVRVYWAGNPARGAFFHYVGWGLGELHEKRTADLAASGFGIELTMKVQAFPEERAADPSRGLALNAPLWPAQLLSVLAVAILRSGRPYGHDHWIQAGEKGFGPEGLRHLACCLDETLGRADTPNGRVDWLQIYTIDDAELEQFKQAERARAACPVLATRKAADPQLVIPRRRPDARRNER
jgi:hypothetical protein